MVVKIKEDYGWTWWDSLKLEIRYAFPVKQIVDFRAYLRNIIINRRHQVPTKLKAGQWYDTDTRMLYGMMNLLIQYVEEEKPLEYINWDGDDHHKHARDEMIAIRDWWLDYDNRCKEIDDALSDWHDAKFGSDEQKSKREDWLQRINEPDTPKIKAEFDHLNELKEKLDQEETDMLIRLIKIRKYLWT